jgi:cellulose biosynthesis protein BcsQ
MRAITVFNNKGGVGKTTFACNLAAYLSLKRKKKVLVIDADPQCNATAYMLSDDSLTKLYADSGRSTIEYFADAIKRGKGYARSGYTARSIDRFGVDLIPGDPSLALFEDRLAQDWRDATSGDPRGLQTTYVFKEMASRYDEYDFVFFDVGPSLGAINRSVLLASDNFILPMSSDLFSYLAVSNISLALSNWLKNLKAGLDRYSDEEGSPFIVRGESVGWKLKFIGYVSQQYIAKAKQGTRQPVKAYDAIIKKFPLVIRRELIAKFGIPGIDDNALYKLGSIPNLHSIVPLSQSAHAPIFELRGKDGVVGAHFTKVRDAEALFMQCSEQLISNIGAERRRVHP